MKQVITLQLCIIVPAGTEVAKIQEAVDAALTEPWSKKFRCLECDWDDWTIKAVQVAHIGKEVAA